jgi:hypothetical protein
MDTRYCLLKISGDNLDLVRSSKFYNQKGPQDAGVIVQRTELDEILKMLECVVATDLPWRTGVSVIELRPAGGQAAPAERGNAAIHFETWNGKGRDRLARAIEVHFLQRLPAEQRPVVIVHDGRGSERAPINDGNFHIHLWSAPSKTEKIQPPQKMYDVPVSNTRESLRHTKEGVPVLDETTWVAAQLLPGNYYILHHIHSHGDDNEAALMSKLMAALAILYPMSEQERAQAMEEFAGEVHQESRERYIKTNYVDVKDKTETVEKQVQAQNAKIADLQQQLVQAVQEARATQETLDRLKAREGMQAEALGKEYDLMMNIPGVIDVIMTKDRLIWYTDLLRATDPRDNVTHDIGRFRNELNFLDPTDPVRMYNLDRRVLMHDTRPGVEKEWQYMNAPHVDEEGRPCLGTAKDTLPKALKQYTFGPVMIVCMQLLQSVNVTKDLWGQSVVDFPVSAPEFQKAAVK